MSGGYVQQPGAGGHQYTNPTGGTSITEAQVATAVVSLFTGRGNSGAVTWAAGTTTLAANVYATTIVAQSGATVRTSGYAVFATTSIDIQSGSIVEYANLNASGASAGGGFAGQFLHGGVSGANGGTGVGANGTNNATRALGGAGGNGGAGGSGAGGTGGTVTAPSAAFGTSLAHVLAAVMGSVSADGGLGQYAGGAGGGAGGGDGVNSGGGGGSGCGWILMVSPSITVAGTVRAKGGDGGVAAAGNCGGGGGGGGGVLVGLAASWNVTGSWVATGGALGTKAGTGVNGIAGSDGVAYRFRPTLTGIEVL